MTRWHVTLAYDTALADNATWNRWVAALADYEGCLTRMPEGTDVSVYVEADSPLKAAYWGTELLDQTIPHPPKGLVVMTEADADIFHDHYGPKE